MELYLIDAQLHTWQPHSGQYPWNDDYSSRLPESVFARFCASSVGPDRLLEMMDASGVQAALLTSPMIYGADHSLALKAARVNPGRFGVVGPIWPETPNLRHRILDFAITSELVGVRLINIGCSEPLDGEAYRVIYKTACEYNVPLFFACGGSLNQVARVARSFPSLTIILDHLGMKPINGFRSLAGDFERLLKLASIDNIAIKCSALPAFSLEQYPFADMWPYLRRLVTAFGVERVMWGSDITEYLSDVSYSQALDYLRLSDMFSESEKAMLLGGTVRRLLSFPSASRGSDGPGSSDMTG